MTNTGFFGDALTGAFFSGAGLTVDPDVASDFLASDFLAGAALVTFVGATFFAGAVAVGDFLAGAFVGATFFAGDFLAGAFFGATFLAGAFFGATFLAGAALVAFFGATFFAGDFLAGAFFAGDFLDGAYLAGAFFGASFLAGAALVAFVAATFFAGAFFAGFFVGIVNPRGSGADQVVRTGENDTPLVCVGHSEHAFDTDVDLVIVETNRRLTHAPLDRFGQCFGRDERHEGLNSTTNGLGNPQSE